MKEAKIIFPFIHQTN